MAHHPPRLLVVLVLVLFHVSASHGSPPSLTYYNNSTACWESFACGSVDIRYPFFLSNATQADANHTNYSCGYTDLKIFCQGEGENKAPILQLGRDKYTVQEIYYGNRTIVLADTEALSGDKCTIVNHNVTLGYGWLSYVNYSVHNLTFFLDCEPLPEIQKYQINCTGSKNPPGAGPGSRGRVSFVFASEEYSIALYYQLAGHCRDVVVVPVFGDALTAGDPSTLPSEYGAVVQKGFELEWSQASRPCYLCEQSSGRCAYSEKKGFLGCLCSGGKELVQDCSSASPSSKFSSILFPRSIWHAVLALSCLV